MMRTMLAVTLALATALPAGAQLGASSSGQAMGQAGEDQAYQSYHDKYADTAAFPRPQSEQKKLDSYLESYHALLPSESVLRSKHPLATPQYKGMTVASAIAASYTEINEFRAGIAQFEGQVKAMSSAAHEAQGDAPNRFLVGQGWKVVKSLAGTFNDQLVPAANDLYAASSKGNQNLEILIEIAGGKVTGTGAPSVLTATKLAGSQSELQLVEEVQQEHNAAVSQHQAGLGPTQTALASVPTEWSLVKKYDDAYVEYERAMKKSLMKSGAGKLGESAVHGVQQAGATLQAASAALDKAEKAEQQAINAVRACTEGTIASLQNPKDTGAASNASNLNQIALAKVEEANSARQAANAIIGAPASAGSLAAGGTVSGREVHYTNSGRDKVSAVRMSKSASEKAQDVQSGTRQAEAADQRP